VLGPIEDDDHLHALHGHQECDVERIFPNEQLQLERLGYTGFELTLCLMMKGVCLMILEMKKICMGISTKGSIINTSSSYPGVNIIPHCRFS